MRRFVIYLLLATHELNAALYYVATTGNDASDGSKGTPWRTIQKASDAAISGDTVRVQPGTYDENVSLTTDGTAGIGRITFLANGKVIVRHFDITGDYVRLIGFELTSTNDTGNNAVSVTEATGVELHDLDIHDTSRDSNGGGLTFGNVTNFLVRGCRFVRTGILGTIGSDSNANAIGALYSYPLSDTVVFEYLSMSNVVEYLNPSGNKLIIRNQVWGPLGTNWLLAHTDGVQPNLGIQNSFIEANWHEENPVDNSHFYLDEVPTTHHVVQRRNVSIRSGDVLVNQWRNSTNHYAAHNIWAETSIGPNQRLGNDHALLIWDSTNNWSYNEVFYLTTTDSLPYDFFGDAQLIIGSYFMYNPGWLDYPSRNLLLATNSFAIDSGTNLTTTVGSGSNATLVTVADAHWFHDGLGMTVGDNIYVGTNNNLTIKKVDWAANLITVVAPISWFEGDPVGYAYRGRGPEIGASEYGDSYLTTATISHVANNYTVNTLGDTRFVVFYVDGIPADPDYAPPFTIVSSGVVTAKAYALHAQPNPVLVAINGSNQGPKIEVVSEQGSNFSIQFPSVMDAGYQLWISDDLWEWHEQGGVIIGNGGTMQITVESRVNKQRFVRLQVSNLTP